MPSTGQARFKTTFTAIVFKPFKGEVMDGKVSNVNKVSTESCRLFVTLLTFQMGFFAMVGPLQVFVSSHVRFALLPPYHNPPTRFVMSLLHRDSRLPMLIYAGRSCSN